MFVFVSQQVLTLASSSHISITISDDVRREQRCWLNLSVCLAFNRIFCFVILSEASGDNDTSAAHPSDTDSDMREKECVWMWTLFFRCCKCSDFSVCSEPDHETRWMFELELPEETWENVLGKDGKLPKVKTWRGMTELKFTNKP